MVPRGCDEVAGSVAGVFEPVVAFVSSADDRRRFARCMTGLVLCGVGFASLVRAELGLDPWDILHQGISEHTGIPMSRESGEVSRNPTCKRQRTFVVPGRGEQYFDMHAKPGASTRIHVWTDVVEDRRVVYVGHCGEHLLLPGGKR